MDILANQSDFNGEDSSGSDGVSLHSLNIPAQETDRFGFLLGSGSTVGTDGPPPEVVRQREAKWLSIISQWDRILSKKTNKVKDQCRKGIPASLRARCWPLLCRATERMSRNENLYKTLDASPALQSWVDVIGRDIDRQFPFHEMFLSRDCHGQRGLFRVLKAYTQFRPDEGYCQGQGPVAAVLLMNMPAEEAFWCLVQISEQYLPGYYSPLLEGMLFDAGVLNGVLRKACPAAHKHLKKHGVEPLMFATDWLMCLYTRHLPFNTLLRVWDLFFCYGVRVLFQVAVVLVRRSLGRQDQRDECEGQMETLERLRGVKERISEEDDAFIEEVCSVSLSRRDLEKEMEKEMVRWKKERPSSTFSPWSRCHGYQAAWIKGREFEAEREKKERELGNLSVPLGRSPSSLSPSFLRKKWRRSSRADINEKDGSGGRGDREVKEALVETLEKTCVERTDAGHADKNGDQGAQNVASVHRQCFEEQRKPQQQTSEGPELDYNRAGQVYDPVNAEVHSEISKPQNRVAVTSHAAPSHGAEPSSGELSAARTSEPMDGASESMEWTQTPDDVTAGAAATDEVTQPASEEARSESCDAAFSVPSEDQIKPSGPQCDSQSHTVHINIEPSEERRSSEPLTADPSALVDKSYRCEDNEAPCQEAHQQHTEVDKEIEVMQDVCTQTVVSESRTQELDKNSPTQREMKELDQQLLEDISKAEGIGQLREEISNATDEPSKEGESIDTSTHCCQASQTIPEPEICIVPIEGDNELSAQIHLNHSSENLNQRTESSECLRHVVTEELVHATSNQFPVCTGKWEELSDVSKGDVLTREQMSNDASQEGPTECHSSSGKTLGGHPSQELEVNIVQAQCQDTAEGPLLDLCLSAEVTVVLTGEVTTGGNREEQKPSLQAESDADTTLAQTQSKNSEGLLSATQTAEGGTMACEQCVSSAEENLLEAVAQKPNGVCLELLQSQPLCSDQEGVREELEITQQKQVDISDVSLRDGEGVREEPENAQQKWFDTSDVSLQDEAKMLHTEPGQPTHHTVAPTAETEMTAETVDADPTEAHIKEGLVAEPQAVTQMPECDDCKTLEGGTESRSCDSPQPHQSEQPGESTEKTRGVEEQRDTEQEDGNKPTCSCSSDPHDTSNKVNDSTKVPRMAISEGEPDQTPAHSATAKAVSDELPEDLSQHDRGESFKYPLPSQSGTGDYKLRKTSSSRLSDPRRLSEDTFKDPHDHDSKDSPAATETAAATVSSTCTAQDTKKGHGPPQAATEHAESSRRFGLFRKFRGDHAKDKDNTEGGAKNKTNAPKMTVPTIVIQDFSEKVGDSEEGLTSKERRKRRREQERRKKEEEKARKKREKEVEKEREKERRKPQTRGKSFQVHSSSKADNVVPPMGNNGSNSVGSKRNSAPYFETYF